MAYKGIQSGSSDMKNEYKIRDEVTVIILKNKKGEAYETLIDTEDLPKVKELNLSWHLRWDNALQQYYAKATRYLGIHNGKPKYESVYLHAVVLGYKNKHIDHINHNTLDNRKSNLKDTSVKKNILNRQGANKNTSTGVRNVSYDRKWNKYIVQLQVDGKNKNFGRYDTLVEAKKVADYWRSKIYDKIINEE